MNNQQQKIDKELDCQVTVDDGSHMTCDMIEEESEEEEETRKD